MRTRTHAHVPDRLAEPRARGRRAIALLLVGVLGACGTAPPGWIPDSLDAFDQAFDDSLTIWTPELPPGVVGQEYRFALNARGQPKPFRWRLASGQLPAGVVLDDGGLLQGTPTQAGVYSFVVKVTSAAVASAKANGQSPHVDWRMRSYAILVKEGLASASLPGAARAEWRRKP